MINFLKNIFSTSSLPDDEPVSEQMKSADPMGFLKLSGNMDDPCDSIRGSYGEFGTDITNPIPVNGPRGAILYLSRLYLISEKSVPFFFHRLGSFESPIAKGLVDQYELISVDASCQIKLFIHQYHPRRSRLAPQGLQLLPWSKMSASHQFFAKVGMFGSHNRVPDFPFGILKQVETNKELASLSDKFPDAVAKQIRQHLLEHIGRWGIPEPVWFTDML